MSFRVFKHEGGVTAVHRPGVLRFEVELVGVTIVGTIVEADSVEEARWNIDLIPMKLIYVDALDMEQEDLPSLPDGIGKRTLIENVLWLHGERLAGWMATAEWTDECMNAFGEEQAA